MAIPGVVRHILVVDDEPAVRRPICRLLARGGYEVRQAGSGLEALRLLREAPADLVLTDLHMAEMDGIELIVAIRAMLPHLPIVAMSGDAPERISALQDAALLGALYTLDKPFPAAALLKTVRQALAGEGRSRA